MITQVAHRNVGNLILKPDSFNIRFRIMNKFSIGSIFGVLLTALVTNAAMGYQVAMEFSATAVQKTPEGPEYSTRMYIGKDNIRKDSIQNNIPVVEIVKLKEQVRIFLVPEEKIYMQIANPRLEKQNIQDRTISAIPCEGLPNTRCEMLGKEEINNRGAEKWEFVATYNNQHYRSLHWVDVEHRMFVREFFPDGTISELTPEGVENVNGRQTEKWLWMLSGADGKMQSATQWYDPELKIMIKEELQGGFLRELREVKTGAQDNNLFKIPAGYKQVESLKEFFKPEENKVPAS